jgi:hypothetical protein
MVTDLLHGDSTADRNRFPERALNMKATEKSFLQPDLRPASVSGNAPCVKRRATAMFMNTALPVIAATLVFCTPIQPRALAQAAQQVDSKQGSAIDPTAMEALDKMGVYLRTLKSFQVRADVATDDVLDDGQTIQFSSKVDLVAARPDRLRIEVTDDDGHRFFFFNGKEFTIFGQVVNYYATVPAPATIAKLADVLNDKYGIELPLVDLFQWGTDDVDIKKITAADDIGPSAVDGVTCEQYAFRQQGVDWQIWIQLGQFPLPRKLVIRTLTDDAKPQHSEILDWNLAPSFSENAFTFTPPADARRITIADIQAHANENK